MDPEELLRLLGFVEPARQDATAIDFSKAVRDGNKEVGGGLRLPEGRQAGFAPDTRNPIQRAIQKVNRAIEDHPVVATARNLSKVFGNPLEGPGALDPINLGALKIFPLSRVPERGGRAVAFRFLGSGGERVGGRGVIDKMPNTGRMAFEAEDVAANQASLGFPINIGRLESELVSDFVSEVPNLRFFSFGDEGVLYLVNRSGQVGTFPLTAGFHRISEDVVRQTLQGRGRRAIGTPASTGRPITAESIETGAAPTVSRESSRRAAQIRSDMIETLRELDIPASAAQGISRDLIDAADLMDNPIGRAMLVEETAAMGRQLGIDESELPRFIERILFEPAGGIELANATADIRERIINNLIKEATGN